MKMKYSNAVVILKKEVVMVSSINSNSSVSQQLQLQRKNIELQEQKAEQENQRKAQVQEKERLEANRVENDRRGKNVNVTV